MPPPASAVAHDKNELFAQYQILEDLGDFPNYSLFKVKAPNGTIKLWKKVDLQFSAASIETRLLPVIDKVVHPYLNAVSNSFLFQDKGLLFVESEFPFKTLRHRLDEVRALSKQNGVPSGGIPVSELFSYVAQAADAMDFLNTAHHPYQGKRIAIYHRALSPDSLHLFEENGKIVCKVGDFGLAKPIVDSNEAARHSLGLTNYDYAPPEFDEGITTNTSDQYSLATTYVELRTGRLPFTGTLLQKLQAQLSGNPDLSLLEPNERPVVARALNREPQARFPSCKEFIRQLQLALGGVVTMPLASPTASSRTAAAAAEPVAASGNALFGGGNSGWALNARPVGKSGGSLFNVATKGQVNTPAKAEGFSLGPTAKAADPAPAAPVVPAAPAPVTPKAPSVNKQPVVKSAPTREATPVQAEGWKIDAPKDPPTPPPAPPARAKAEKPASKQARGSGSGLSNPDIALTPPPPTPAPRGESISSKARETLELIKRKQNTSAAQAMSPSMSMDKQVPGSKFVGTSTGGMPAMPPAGRTPPARPGSRPGGALGETPAPPRPNLPAPRRTTPNMGVPLPTRPAPANAVARTASPVPVPRRGSSGGGIAPAGKNSPNPFDNIQNNLPAAPKSATSLVTLIMVSIAAFCVGMLVLAYLARK